MSLTKLYLAGNSLIIPKLFLAGNSLIIPKLSLHGRENFIIPGYGEFG
jgi:hypothetical protein